MTQISIKNHKIAIVDDEKIFRDSLKPILSMEGCSVICFKNGSEFLNYMKSKRADIVLLDMELPDLNGIDIQTYINENDLDISIIFISGQSSNSQVAQAFRSGAYDFLVKPFSSKELLDSLKSVLEKKKVIDNKIFNARLVRKKYSLLTEREKEVLNYLAKGLSNIAIGEILKVSPATIKVHKRRIFDKMQVDSNAELALQLVHSDLNVFL